MKSLKLQLAASLLLLFSAASAFAQQSPAVPAPSPQGPSYYYIDAGKRVGPVPFAQIGELVKSGRIKPDTFVWADGMSDWLPARKVSRLAAILPKKPKGPPKLPDTDWKSFMAGTWNSQMSQQQQGIVTTVRTTQTFSADGTWYGLFETSASSQGLQVPPVTSQAQGTWDAKKVHGETFTITVTVNNQSETNKMKRLGPNLVRNESMGFEARRIAQ